MKKIVINVESDLITALQAAQYKKEAKQNIIVHILGNSMLNISKELYDKYCNDYLTAYAEYEAIKDEVSTMYLNQLGLSNVNWSINFANMSMSIEVDDDFDISNYNDSVKEGGEV